MSTATPTAESNPTVKPKASRRALGLRFASGAVLVPFLLGVAYFGTPGTVGGIVYGLVICTASGLAAFELRQMLRSGGYQPLTFVLVGVSILLPLDAWLRPSSPPAIATDGVLIVELGALLGLIALLVRKSVDRALLDWALSLSLALYIGGLMQFFMPLRSGPSPAPGFWVIALLVLSWVCDSSAYFVGGAYGRARLAPLISPAKSVEGAVAGVVFTPLAGALLSLPVQQSPLLLLGYGLVIALATIVGDLAESLIKRQTGVKDSGVLIPGHGGLLDRMDSLLFCAPAAVLYLHVFAA